MKSYAELTKQGAPRLKGLAQYIGYSEGTYPQQPSCDKTLTRSTRPGAKEKLRQERRSLNKRTRRILKRELEYN